jgi:hypothetical protein
MIAPAIFAAIAVIVGAFLLWRRGPISYASCALFAVLLVSMAGISWASLGLPKPLWAEYPLPEKAVVLGYALEEPRAINLLLGMPDGPRLYRLPWDEKQAAGLTDAAGKAKAQHAPLMMTMSAIEGSGKPGASGTKDTEKPQFYPQPRPALPEKQGE